MGRLARWSRSLPTLVLLNAALVSAAVGIGGQTGALSGDSVLTGVRTIRPVVVERTRWQHASHILRGNLGVVGGLLAGICTLGGLTVLTLLWNAYVLGHGLSVLGHATPEAVPLVLRYALLEFSSFVLVASVAEHLVGTVLRCLVASEPPQFAAGLLTLVVAIAMLTVAALIEADVAQLVAGASL